MDILTARNLIWSLRRSALDIPIPRPGDPARSRIIRLRMDLLSQIDELNLLIEDSLPF
jgi:hypothetical protein